MSRLLHFINFCLLCISLFIIALTLYQCFTKESCEPVVIPKAISKELPKNPFALPEIAYSSIKEGPFATHWTEPKPQLPDLREEVIYLGKNKRPDMNEQQEVTILLKNSGDSKKVLLGQRVYLQFRKNYFFTPNNKPSNLWMEFYRQESDSIDVSLSLLDEKGQLIEAPFAHAQFTLLASEAHTHSSSHWEIDQLKVDSTLLVRQRARWIGKDLFLEMHGGNEFAYAEGKQRIDFLSDSPYSCFVQEGDFLIWKNGRWQEIKNGDSSKNYPLLVAKKIDEKLLTFELWDLDGKNKTNLHLIKSKELSNLPNLEQDFKFVGAKTFAQYIIETGSERILVKPDDWLIFSGGIWKKITSAKQIDDYVNQNLTGPLFILDKMTKQNGQQVLIGHLFNTSRTEMVEIQIPAQQSSLSQTHLPSSPGMGHREQSEIGPLSSLEYRAEQLSKGMYKTLRGN